MSNGTSTIIIKGSSAEVVFDQAVFEEIEPGRHGNADKKITRVVITGDLDWDSGAKQDGWQCEITAHCE